MLGWIRHEPLGFLEITSECEDAEDMIDYIQTREKERRMGRTAGGREKRERLEKWGWTRAILL